MDVFQFHNGSIKSKSLFSAILISLLIQFQFHNGSIKSQFMEQRQWRIEAMFQFHNGSIKSDIDDETDADIAQVSIPQWFD